MLRMALGNSIIAKAHTSNSFSRCRHGEIYLRIIRVQVVPPQVKSTPVTGHAGPEGSSRVKAPRFLDNGTVMVLGCQPYAPAAFTTRSIPGDRKHIWY